MRNSKALLCLVAIAFFFGIVVVVLGAFTRLADAGLGCPDWPTCYGHFWVPDTHEEISHANKQFSNTPVETDKTWPEQSHRLVASTLGFLVMIIFIWSYIQSDAKQKLSVALLLFILVVGVITRIIVGTSIEPYLWLLVAIYFINLIRVSRYTSTTPFKLPAVLAGLILVQGLFGMWTVTLKLWPQVVTGHLLGGFTTLALLWLLLQRVLQHVSQASSKVCLCRWSLLDDYHLGILKRVSIIALGVVCLQITLGGWTAANYAALACPDFPLCQNKVFPPTDFLQGFNIFQHVGPNYLGGLLDNHARTAIHLTHRIGAFTVCIVLIYLTILLLRLHNKKATGMAFILLLVLFGQVILGILNVKLGLPLLVAVAHNAIGALLLLTILTIVHRLYTATYRNYDT